MIEKIKKIIDFAIWAPSGDNSQPWRFELQDNKLYLFNLPDKDNPYLNYRQSGSLIAHGALLKNIQIAASHNGLDVSIDLFPESKEDLVALITFTEKTLGRNEISLDTVKKRETNRRKYRNTLLIDEEWAFLNSFKIPDSIKIFFIEDRKKIFQAASGGSASEIIILENRILHDYLFKDVMWSERQEKRERHGLYMKAMEFNPIQGFLFRLASHWLLMKLAIIFKFPYFIARQDADLYSSGATLGVISITNPIPENFLRIGEVMQELWLRSTQLNLSFQPITATLFLNFRLLNEPEENILSKKHKDLARESFRKIKNAFDLKNEIPFVMFRIGHSLSASAHSSRKEVQLKLHNN